MADKVGNESKADTSGAGLGGGTHLVGNASLTHAVGHLKAEHPVSWNDHGPHHEMRGMTKHMPLHGMKPGGKC